MIDRELKKRIESILFAAGKYLPIVDIAKLAGTRDLTLVEEGLRELQHEYQQEDRSFVVLNQDTTWKLAVRDRYMSVVSQMITHTELSKTCMETLAVIAYKAPMLQSHLIKIRTNKAYDHLAMLENTGYISRIKKGRTKEIRLADKFFEYFDVPQDRLKEKFRTVHEMELAIEGREKDIEQQKKVFAEKRDDAQKKEEHFKTEVALESARLDDAIARSPTIELLDNHGTSTILETYKTIPLQDIPKPFSEGLVLEEKQQLHGMDVVTAKPIENEPRHLGDLEVYERKKRGKNHKVEETEEKEEQLHSAIETNTEILITSHFTPPTPQKSIAETITPIESEEMTGGFAFGPEIDSLIDKKVAELLRPERAEGETEPEQNTEKTNDETNEDEVKSEEEKDQT